MPKPAAKKPPARPPKRIDKRGTKKGQGAVLGGPGAKSSGAKPKGRILPNPPHVATPALRQLAETHAAVGTPHWAIAAEMDISADTLERHYRAELDRGLIRMNARIGSSIAKKALAGDGDMQKFWMARRGGPAWANKQQTELSGPEGGAIAVTISGSDSKL